jgi:hypothetical protein
MAGVLGLLGLIWFVGWMASWGYFWATKTDKSSAPIVRRGVGCAFGFIWPLMVIKYFVDRQGAANVASQQTDLERRIIGGQDSDPRPPQGGGPSTGSRIDNPFDPQ